ncbi:hypothetical protein JIG36_12440 [Actinoplanes sp. LDG1-06]|uniref:Uncharacterized protein n=1 Tax=Paractinoplanes ovalisporus TaxID=2810368 RepID=A0ABS2A955_9ACTN|nr:hypothetical protein [Actinoplanes ovalisporus]MBM2616366.1 hypothetical protein [Actinoplanes ovalisporus]
MYPLPEGYSDAEPAPLLCAGAMARAADALTDLAADRVDGVAVLLP